MAKKVKSKSGRSMERMPSIPSSDIRSSFIDCRGRRWRWVVDNRMRDYGDIDYERRVIRINRNIHRRDGELLIGSRSPIERIVHALGAIGQSVCGRSDGVKLRLATDRRVYFELVHLRNPLLTVAAASIAFGGDKSPQGVQRIVVAKLILAWSIFYGVLFCAFVLYRYDEYTQDVKSYTRWWYSTVESLAFASLVCFVAGYLVWGWGLSKLS